MINRVEMYLLLGGFDLFQVEINPLQVGPDIFLDRNQVAVWSQQDDAYPSLLEEIAALYAVVITGAIEAVNDSIHLVGVVLPYELM